MFRILLQIESDLNTGESTIPGTSSASQADGVPTRPKADIWLFRDFCSADIMPDGGAMNDKTVGGVHWSFRIIGAVALIWNVVGVINFFVQVNPDALAAYRESERAIIEGRPAWATGAFVIAVFGGALGSLLLLPQEARQHRLG